MRPPKDRGCGGARTELRGGRGPGGLTLLLLQSQLALVVTVELASEQKREFRVVLLLLHRHFLELGPVASHELSELIDDISKLLVCRTEEKTSMGAARTRRPGRGPLGRAAARRPSTGPEWGQARALECGDPRERPREERRGRSALRLRSGNSERHGRPAGARGENLTTSAQGWASPSGGSGISMAAAAGNVLRRLTIAHQHRPQKPAGSVAKGAVYGGLAGRFCAPFTAVAGKPRK